MEEAFWDERERFGAGESWTDEVNSRRTGSLGYENDVVGIGKLAVEVDGEGVREAAFGAGVIERKGEKVEAIGGPADGGEDNGAFGIHFFINKLCCTSRK